uniref:HAT C-terminal dimerisation domain-containing protein n=1 Tax=Daphnia galeata TaxID=27404 RepID=A0A8J2RPL1_9CRUS|nr:unnamed protein product [Daphnia galeata]
MTDKASTSYGNKSNGLVHEDEDVLDLLDDKDSEFYETDDDEDATITEDIGGDRVVDDQEAVERNDENLDDEKNERHESDRFDIAFPLMDILDEGYTSENVYVLPPHRRCACHSLNLICKCDIFKNMNPSLKNLFDSTDEVPRWNSYYNAMKRTKHFINKKRSELKALFEFDGIQYFHPAEEELVREYVKIMKPMTEALDILQADVNLSIGYLLPTLTILILKLEKLLNDRTVKHCKSLIRVMISSIKTRFQDCFEDEELILAAILHPNLKNKWFSENDREAKTRLLIDTFKSHKQDTVCATTTNEEQQTMSVSLKTVTTAQNPKKKKYFFKTLYDPVDADKYPALKQLFLKYNAALPSSASVERLFSLSGRIFVPLRNGLSDINFERLLFLKVKQKF